MKVRKKTPILVNFFFLITVFWTVKIATCGVLYMMREALQDHYSEGLKEELDKMKRIEIWEVKKAFLFFYNMFLCRSTDL